MKNRLFRHRFGGFATLLLLIIAPLAEGNELQLMSYNLRYASDQPPHAWPDRKPIMVRLIENESPDIMGTQEGRFQQLQDLAVKLPEYAWVGLGREGGSRGEFCAIFYRSDRFELMEFDHFWLSDTPETIASITWGHRHHRMATWARFRESQSGQELIVLNTHFDHRMAEARHKSALLIRDRLKQFPSDLPVVVMGDFNCLAETSIPFQVLTTETGLVDSWLSADQRSPAQAPNTFSGYEPPVWEGERIDWILVSESLAVSSATIVTYEEDGAYPSDHFPVTATIRLGKED